MKILVIEDEDYKYNDIHKYLMNLGENNITRKSSRNAGLLEIMTQYNNGTPYDIIICDNYMPLYENERHTIEAFGIDIVNHIRHRYDDNLFICMCSSAELEVADYNYKINYNMSVDLSNEFKEMLNQALKHNCN